MSVNPLKYKPPNISQRDILLAADGVDDCRVVSTTWLAGAATLGEIFVHPNGNPMGRRNLVALAKKARRSLGPSFATGPLNTTATTNMLRYLVPDAPTLTYISIPFEELRDYLRKGYSASLSGNPAHIKGDSPLKRAGNVGHEFGLWGEQNDRILVGDPYRPYSPRFGEWRPVKEVRQFAFKDSDRTVTACFVIPRGAWTREALLAVDMSKRLSNLRDTNRALRAELEQRPPTAIDVPAIKDKLTIAMNAQQEAWDLLS